MGHKTLRYQGIIFDLDGVLISTDTYHYRAWKTIADSLNIPFNETHNNLLRGVSRMESLDIILSLGKTTLSSEEKILLTEEKNRIYREMLAELSPWSVKPEVTETLLSIKGMGIKTAVGSSSKNARYILEKIGLINSFDAIVDGNGITKTKPAPEVFINAAEMLCLAPPEILVVEDALAGIEAAIRGGFGAAALGDARHTKHTVYHLERFSDLMRYLE
jgi:beta-phosphoglucomutase